MTGLLARWDARAAASRRWRQTHPAARHGGAHRPPSLPPARPCSQCGRTFQPPTAWPQRYCSPACRRYAHAVQSTAVQQRRRIALRLTKTKEPSHNHCDGPAPSDLALVASGAALSEA